MKRRGSGGVGGGSGHGPSSGASSGRRRKREEDGEGETEGKLRIHLKRSCTNKRMMTQGNADLALTTDDWQKFQKLLASKTFAAHDTQRIKGENLTAEWAEKSGFREPVIVPDKAGTGLMMPDASFTVADVARIVGEEKQIRPIHVGEQANIDQSMSLAEFAEYFETCTKPGQAILNMISLEFSDTPMAELVRSPKLVRDMDWINRCWPDDRKRVGQFPKVQYYCLMSQGGSYTDFHVDFGGTSVWYHILQGKKEFLLVRPTQSNLELYEDWIRSPTQSQVFFGDLADICYRVVLNAGETLMIPSGWIHAVFTPKPSLVFGGNFLHSVNIPMQLKIDAIETRAKIQYKFRFPYFKELVFFVASWYVRALREQEAKGHVSRRGDAIESRSDGDADGEGVETAESAERTDAGAIAARAAATPRTPLHGAGSKLSPWEKEGLPSLIEACRQWLAEGGDSGSEGAGRGEKSVPEEWHAAATAAGCADLDEMLRELSLLASNLEQDQSETDWVWTKGSARTVHRVGEASLKKTAVPERLGFDNGGGNVDQHGAAKGSGGEGGGGEGIRVRSGTPPQTKTSPASVDSGGGAGSSTSMLTEKAGGSGGVGEGARKPGNPTDHKEAHTGPTIPRLKISIKPPSLRAARAGEMSLARNGVKASPTTGAEAEASVGGSGSTRKSLKLVLKRPSVASATASAPAPASRSTTVVGVGHQGGAPEADEGVGHKRSRRPTEKARWKQEVEEDLKSVFGSSSGGSDGNDNGEDSDGDDERGKVGSGTVAKDDDEEWTGESRVGKGRKRKGRPLGSRLRAIARLGDDAAAGDSAEDSADEYKPEAEDDEMLTEDHNLNLDDQDVRETKKARASSQRPAKDSAAASTGRAGNSGSGLAAGGGAGGGQGTGLGRFVSATKQEALRSKGLFKIAPQSKVQAPQAKKEKKPLTAKQKLLAKMRR
ncbi:unnamed protein product [Ascophyllum nodosum]